MPHIEWRLSRWPGAVPVVIALLGLLVWLHPDPESTSRRQRWIAEGLGRWVFLGMMLMIALSGCNSIVHALLGRPALRADRGGLAIWSHWRVRRAPWDDVVEVVFDSTWCTVDLTQAPTAQAFRFPGSRHLRVHKRLIRGSLGSVHEALALWMSENGPSHVIVRSNV